MSHVLVIGGGLAGVTAIKGLRKRNATAEITLVEPKEYMEIVWAAYRTPFEVKVANDSLCALDPFCTKNKVTHIHSIVVSLEKGIAKLENGDSVNYDVCVITTGAKTTWNGLGRGPSIIQSGTIKERLEQAKNIGKGVLDAGSVLIVGGGLVGTELAGDIMGFSKKSVKPMVVTIVHSGDHLCPEFDEKAAKMVQKQLEGNGVNIFLNERATETADGKWRLKSGKIIDAEETIMTIGINACNDFLTGGDLEGSLNEKGWVETDNFFRVKGSNGTVFALGDCCTAMPNSGTHILENLKTISINLDLTLKAITSKKSVDTTIRGMKEFKLAPDAYVVTTGPNSGVFYSSFITTKRFFPWIKNKTMFFMRPTGMLGIKPSTEKPILAATPMVRDNQDEDMEVDC